MPQDRTPRYAPRYAPAALAVPSLLTERLSLTGPRRDDFDDIAALWAEPKVVEHITRRPLSREECWSRFLRSLGHWIHLGFGYWVVRERATGRFGGEVGLADLQRDMVPSCHGVPEAGWVLAPWAHGQGYATEAALAALSWCQEVLAPPRVVCLIDPRNHGSLAVAAKCQFEEVTRAPYAGAEVVLLQRWFAPPDGVTGT
ncbi:MAG: GNAT family N-acetyltransferase [Myxococcales bacterium]|nr:GNAT family N-acetyltransferase [Myxococcales bacterium]